MDEKVETTMRSMRGMLTLVLLMVIIALGAYSYNTFLKAGQVGDDVATITVSGEGEIFAKPDIATFSFSVRAEGADAQTAQEESANAVNDILGYLEDEGVAEKDIKTLYYNLNPRYDYVRSVCTTGGYCPPGERILRGYEVNQTIQVKVRDIDAAGALISGAGSRGATDVSSLQFTIDDEDEFVAEARKEAIDDAKAKAKKLASDLGVRLVRIVGFNEGGGYPVMYQAKTMSMDMAEDEMGMGGAPSIPVGENTFNSNVSITYEVR